MRGVAQEHDVPRVPASIPHRGEAAPDGPVGEEGVALQLVLEEPLQVGDRALLVVLGEAAGLPGLLPGLDDEGRAARGVLVRMGPPQTGRRRLEVERERGKGAGGPEPDEAVAAPVEAGLELVREPVADQARRAVRGDHQIGLGKTAVGDLANLLLPMHLHSQRVCPPSQQLQQGLPLHPRKAMPRGPRDGATVVDLDVLPVRRRRSHGSVGLGISLADVLEGLVGEHHPEAERVLEPVPLVHGHLVARVVTLEQDGEIEARGTRAHDRYSHRVVGSHAGATSLRRPSGVKGVSSPSRSVWSQSLQVTGLCTWSRPSQ